MHKMNLGQKCYWRNVVEIKLKGGSFNVDAGMRIEDIKLSRSTPGQSTRPASWHPSLSHIITSLMEATFDLFQPLCHGQNQHLHLVRVKKKRQIFSGAGATCADEQQWQSGRKISSERMERLGMNRTRKKRRRKLDRWRMKGTAGSSEEERREE